MTIHIERHSVPQSMNPGTRQVTHTEVPVPDTTAIGHLNRRQDHGGVEALRDHGRRIRAVGKADMLERLAVVRNSAPTADSLGASTRRQQVERNFRSWDRFARPVPEEDHRPRARRIDSRQCGADEIPAQTQRSIERMQTVTAAALGVIAGFVLFLFLLYAG